MDEKISKIVEIIGNYREDDIGFLYQTNIDNNYVRRWLSQFDEDDREFLVDELLHLLPSSYLTKQTTLEIISTEFEIISRDYGYDNVNDFLDETKFLDCQHPGKSQKVFLELINGILEEKYNRTIDSCGTTTIRNWFYTDDVLASGGTFREEILSEIASYGIDKFINSDIRIIGSFVILHDWAVKNVKFTIDQKLKTTLGNRIKLYRVAEIENNPLINVYNPNPKFNHIYPIESKIGNEILNFIEEEFNDDDYEFRNEKFAFRNEDYPKEETFFSSKDNRIRYENILLKKGFEIMQRIENINAKSLRPLGMTNPSNKTLGSGTHFFTWRNISNTCPIVFWWGSNNWIPLFPVKLRGNNLW
ncbi:phosphoribosyltransferase-like protein [Myroides odoratimimus]|uniref:phosphoribosyltransferase-like protein n=1 Tax=Myroides odoratimimus TaxID=76832 RepID=UPI002DBCF90B|nr:hypothetical protein [Myroides odoratimimus]MEC4095414.1 hypothetical protein [Myroides odoratimimus]